MTYSCIVADDNLIDRDLIIKYLSKIDNIKLIASCADGHEAAKILANEPVDILFSDIDMPQLSGMGLVKSLKQPPVVVFITSHAEYAIEGFNLDVVDFVVKPLTFERFYKAANKATEYVALKKAFNHKKENVNEDAFSVDKNDIDSHFFIRETSGLTKINFNEVLYIESMGDYSKIFTKTRKHITLVSLKNIEKQLPESTFKRIHKQYMVNLDRIVTIAANDVVLSDGQLIPISIASRQEIIELLVNNKVLTRASV